MVWEVRKTDDGVDVVCGMVPKCMFCGVDMELWMAKKLHFDIVRGSGDGCGHALDVEVSCPKCGLESVFGVAISRGEYNLIGDGA